MDTHVDRRTALQFVERHGIVLELAHGPVVTSPTPRLASAFAETSGVIRKAIRSDRSRSCWLGFAEGATKAPLTGVLFIRQSR